MPAEPGAKGTAETKTDFKKTEDNADFPAREYVADDGAISRVAGAMADAVRARQRGKSTRAGAPRSLRRGRRRPWRLRGGDSVSFVAPEPVRKVSPRLRRAILMNDEAEIEGRGQLVDADGNKVGDGMGIDHE